MTYTLSCRSGHQNSNADCMSRLKLNVENVKKEAELSKMNNHVFLMELEYTPVTSNEVAYFTNDDLLSSKLYNYVSHGWPSIISRRRDKLSCKNLHIQWAGRVSTCTITFGTIHLVRSQYFP